MCSLSKMSVACQGSTQSTFIKVACLQLDSYFTIFKLKILSLKLSSISHSSKNLIHNSETEIGVGMESWERMERKKKNIYLTPS